MPHRQRCSGHVEGLGHLRPTGGGPCHVHADDDAFDGIVGVLKKNLEGKFHATTGRGLELFLDREAIGWGDDWRDQIRYSAEQATVFIPVVSMRYFESEACRQELQFYYENARRLGVERQLILPVVIAGADAISSKDSRAEVRLIEKLQYRNVQHSYEEGFDSPSWRKDIRWMVDQLRDRVAVAESSIADKQVKNVSGRPDVEVSGDQRGSSFRQSDNDGDRAADADATAGQVEVDLGAVSGRIEAFVRKVGTANDLLQAFGAAASEGFKDVTPGNSSQQQDGITRAAQLITGPAKAIGDLGRDLDAEAAVVDADLRTLFRELDSLASPIGKEQAAVLRASLAETSDVAEALGQLDQLVDQMRLAAMLNVAMRRALTPAIEGMQGISSAAATVSSWAAL